MYIWKNGGCGGGEWLCKYISFSIHAIEKYEIEHALKFNSTSYTQIVKKKKLYSGRQGAGSGHPNFSHWKKIVVHIDSVHWVLHVSLN